MASTTILHVDMDAFFASVEQLDDPRLRGKSMVVGGSHRGVVAAASYEARKYGIRSAMPIFEARLKCPQLMIVPPRHHRYAELSRQVMEILRTFSPLVEPVSIDEAFVDLTGCERLYGDWRTSGLAVKERIRSLTGLTCSVGIAPNKFLAKIASDLNKPDGLTLIAPELVIPFIDALPVAKVPGVGPHAEQRLAGLGALTLGQVRGVPEGRLVRRLGKFGHRLIELANGRDASPVVTASIVKSVSSESTLAHDTTDRKALCGQLLIQSETVARQLRKERLRARTIVLKMKNADFTLHTRSHTLPSPVQSSETIYHAAVRLLEAFAIVQPVRLIGVGAGNLQPEQMPVQQELFGGANDEKQERWEKVDRALDAITERFGSSTVGRGDIHHLRKGAQEEP